MPYRHNQTALLVRKQVLESEIRDLEDRSREYERLRKEERNRQREIEDINSVLGESRPVKRSLTLLDNVRVAAPCTKAWEAMKGDERVRFCDACAKNVYNLSALTAKEAEALLLEKEENICVRLYRRSDGTVLTADCPVGAEVRRSRNRVAGIVAAASAAVAAVSVAGLRSQASSAPHPNVAHYSGTIVDATPALVGWSAGEPSFTRNPDGSYPTAEELFQKDYDFAMKRAKR